MADLKPGNLTNEKEDFTEFFGSMAEMIEEELDELLELDDLPKLLKDPADREVRDRRRFIIAITRGMVRHLVERSDAFVIVEGPDPIHLEIQSEQLE